LRLSWDWAIRRDAGLFSGAGEASALPAFRKSSLEKKFLERSGCCRLGLRLPSATDPLFKARSIP
jgi:hypothetical protein